MDAAGARRRRRRRRRRGGLMYAVVAHFQLVAPLADEQARRVERELLDPLPATAGFRSFYAVRTGETQISVFHVWDSRADAEAAVQRFSAWVQINLSHALAASPERRAGDVMCVRLA